MMMLSLHAAWLYSCLSQTAGGNWVTPIRGDPPPGQAAVVQLWNAVVTICSVSAAVMPSFGEPSFWTEKPTQGFGQASSRPQSVAVGGTQTAAVIMLAEQNEVRQYACAVPAGSRSARPRPSAASLPSLRIAGLPELLDGRRRVLEGGAHEPLLRRER